MNDQIEAAEYRPKGSLARAVGLLRMSSVTQNVDVMRRVTSSSATRAAGVPIERSTSSLQAGLLCLPFNSEDAERGILIADGISVLGSL
jgi:hypothetical protein